MTETQGELWYEWMIPELSAAQDISRASHMALAGAWRSASANLLMIAEAHETLARQVLSTYYGLRVLARVQKDRNALLNVVESALSAL